MPRFPRIRPAAIAALLIAAGAIRMASTFRVFSATSDEATHIGAGLEMYQYHRYLFQRENPPLPRLVLAIAPYLGGMRYDNRGNFPEQIHSIFYGRGDYRANLFRARVGNILFFVIAAVALFVTARDALGGRASLFALFLFTMEPVVLGYSAVATHDAAATAGVAVTLFAFTRWLRRPRLQSALLFGAAFGFSILCKFSCIPFGAVACLAIGVVRLVHDAELRAEVRRAAATLVPAACAAIVVVWAGYGFSVGTFGELQPWGPVFSLSLQRLLTRMSPRTPLPAANFFIGIAGLLKYDQRGYLTYLCGQILRSGRWWYFPFAIALKTTIAALILFVTGIWLALRDRELRWAFAEWSVAAIAMIVVAMPSALDLGVRYLLPFYVPFAIAAACTVAAMLRGPRALNILAITLLLAHGGASAFAHPDYFPYFNALGGSDPSQYLVDSNIDWGQDILRLRSVARREHMEKLTVSLMGPADYVALGFPPIEPASPWAESHGWVAVSDHSYRLTSAEGGWKWLPVTYRRVGKSIRLYHIP
ncbi:MAG TPA: glycosyltransferase family 39 protein [Thermoanaerobaculia bacterium]|jgi:4-amino-4-deoxy-L-arabinose transferase-like glycosyltransferase|nr:glycosyltransferase family 39 protein [Thermoanaerobaculia bacterium]